VRGDDLRTTKADDDGNDATKQMMLIFMPVFIGYITITFPAGLGIYWVVSNLVQIFQQWFMNRKTTTA